MEKENGFFVISLDFELFWGMADVTTLKAYGPNVLGERTAIPAILELFSRFGIHATWATVGMLMARTKEELLSLLPPPEDRPRYEDMRLSTYYHLETDGVGTNEKDDPYHFGPSLIELIQKTPHQYIGNHTFSHYYTVDGHTNSDAIFERDLASHAKIAKTYGVTTTSMVFPRNQTTPEALLVCAKAGIRAYRGNEDHFLYRARASGHPLWVRALRLMDHYLNLSGYHTFQIKVEENGIMNIPSSRFLRPYSPLLGFLEPLRLRRIKNAMTHAAKDGKVFHLWWHPHNFGIHQKENLKNLSSILEHFKYLEKKYGMKSASMEDIVTLSS